MNMKMKATVVVGNSRLILLMLLSLVILCHFDVCQSMTKEEKASLKATALEMFHHAFKHYMDFAYPADELMPLSCKGRYRGSAQSRGDIDDVLGNYSLSLIDSLDTLVILGELDLFENSVKKVIQGVRFDNDIVVSVFEVNIRVVGGLLGGHLMAEHLKKKLNRMLWYRGELLEFARDLGDRLLPAFNTSTGMPYPRVNLKYGISHDMSRTGHEKDTCTACAGTMILEFSALSRLTGRKIYEEKAAKAMDYLWQSRHRMSDLVGTVINIQNGDWVRKESGVGAGIDSYYEYLLKAYIMLGNDLYLDRFNTHYKAIMKYVNNGPLMLDVHMHRPQTNSRNFMDSLLAFWPGLQVLKGDLKPAIEIHEMLYQVMLRHNFLPEAFTSDFRVHWAQHPLRPEFLESTYFIYRATGDPHYLEVGKKVMENLNKIARVKCGFAAIKDVTTGDHEDQMDSFVFAETFKYLYLLFSEKEDLVVDVDDFIFTTEAHLLPLFLSMHGQANQTEDIPSHILQSLKEEDEEEDDDEDETGEFSNTCPSTSHLFKGTINYAQDLRSPLKNMVERLCPRPMQRTGGRLRAVDFIAGNKEQMEHLNEMGIRLITMNDGRVQLVHVSSEAISPEASHDGMLFMQEMIELSKSQSKEVPLEPRVVQLLSSPIFGGIVLKAGPAQFGLNLKNHQGIEGQVVKADPHDGCSPLKNRQDVQAKIVVVERGGCMFVEKARNIQEAGGIAGIVFDNNSESSSASSQYFSMSGDGKSDVKIPAVFLFSEQAKILHNALASNNELVVYVGENPIKPEEVLKKFVDVKSTVEQFAKALENIVDSKRSKDTIEKDFPAFDEKTYKDLKFILNYLKLDQLIPLIRPRGSNLLNDDFIGTSQVKVIRQMVTPGNFDKEHTSESLKNEEQNKRGDDEMRKVKNEQRRVRLIFGELMLLLQKCTNIGKLQLAMEFDFKKMTDALARLTEHAYTSGAMGFGVETESMLERIKNRLTINSYDEECLPSKPANKETFKEKIENQDVGKNVDEDEKIIFSVAKTLNIDSKELNNVLDQFVESQVADLFKQLWVATTTTDNNNNEKLFKLQDNTQEQMELELNDKESTTGIHAGRDASKETSEDAFIKSHKVLFPSTLEYKKVMEMVRKMTQGGQSGKAPTNFATITCNQGGCVEISLEEKDSLVIEKTEEKKDESTVNNYGKVDSDEHLLSDHSSLQDDDDDDEKKDGDSEMSNLSGKSCSTRSSDVPSHFPSETKTSTFVASPSLSYENNSDDSKDKDAT